MRNIFIIFSLLLLANCSGIVELNTSNTPSHSKIEPQGKKCANLSHSINLMTERIVAGTYENGVIDETKENTKYTDDAQKALYTISSMYTIYKIDGCGQ